jgi:hypothetical protein
MSDEVRRAKRAETTNAEPALTNEQIESEAAAELPDRQAMSLLDLNANLDLNLDVTAPVDAAVAANANAAAPIDASVSANVLSADSVSGSAAPQETLITQNLDGTATATAPQTSDVTQS